MESVCGPRCRASWLFAETRGHRTPGGRAPSEGRGLGDGSSSSPVALVLSLLSSIYSPARRPQQGKVPCSCSYGQGVGEAWSRLGLTNTPSLTRPQQAQGKQWSLLWCRGHASGTLWKAAQGVGLDSRLAGALVLWVPGLFPSSSSCSFRKDMCWPHVGGLGRTFAAFLGAVAPRCPHGERPVGSQAPRGTVSGPTEPHGVGRSLGLEPSLSLERCLRGCA